MIKYVYGDDKHRAINSDELIKLLSQTKGLTVKTVTDILAVNANNKTKALLRSNLISVEDLTGITAGRAPRIFYKVGVKTNIDSILDSMTFGYAMWYLRQKNLLTTSVNIDNSFSLSTYLALKSDIYDHFLLRVKLVLFDKNIEDTIKNTLKFNYCPIVITNFNEKEYCYDKVSSLVGDKVALIIVIKQRQNAKYLSATLISSRGVFELDDDNEEDFNNALLKLNDIKDDELYDDILAKYKKAEVLRRQHVPSLLSKRGVSDED